MLLTGAGSFLYGLKNEKSFETDGVDEGGQSATTSNLNFLNHDAPISIAFWAKVDTITASGSEFFIVLGETTNRFLGIRYNSANGKLGYTMVTAPTSAGYFFHSANQSDLSANTWTHIVYTYDGGSAASGSKIYVDGTSVTMDTPFIENSFTQDILTSDPQVDLASSSKDGGAKYLAGHMDQVAIYDKELSSSEVTEIYNGGSSNIDLRNLDSATNLKAYYPTGELNDNTDSTNGKTSAGTFQSKSFLLDGVDDYADTSDTTLTEIEPDDARSISFWTKPDSTINTWKRVWTNGRNGASNLGLIVQNNGAKQFHCSFLASSGANARAWVIEPFVVDQWYFVVLTKSTATDETAFTWYINGSLAAISTAAGDVGGSDTTAGQGHSIGGTVGGGAYWDGAIDQFVLWDKELSASEVSTLYNGGDSDININDVSFASNIIVYYPLGEGTGDETDTALTEKIDNYEGTAAGDLTPKNTEAGDLQSEWAYWTNPTIEDVVNSENLTPDNTEAADTTSDIA